MKPEITPLERRPAPITKINIGGLVVEHLVPHEKRFSFPLFIQHGMWCKGPMCHNLMRTFGAMGYESFAPSWRGHGTSKPVNNIGETSIEHYVEDDASILRQLQRQMVYVGHSLGAIAGSQVVLNNNHLTVAFVALSSAPPRWVKMGNEAMMTMPGYLGRMATKKPVMLTPPHARSLLFNTMTNDEEFGRMYSQMCPESGLAALQVTLWKYRMRPLDCPAFVIAGGQDTITPNQWSVAKKLGLGEEDYNLIHHYSHMDCLLDPDGHVADRVNHWLHQKVAEGFIA